MTVRREKLGKLVLRPNSGPPGPLPPEARPASGSGWLLLALLAVSAVAVLVVLWQNGWLPAQFSPRRIVLRGCDLTPPGAVLERLNTQAGHSYLAWWQAARSTELSDARWLSKVEASPLAGRTMLLRALERRPLLRVESAGAGYWMCDDYSLVKAQLDDHQLELFQRIKQQPIIELDGVSVSDTGALGPRLTEAAALCATVIPGQITRISVKPDGSLKLRDSKGLEIRLGNDDALAIKLAALPKALRALSAERGRVAYLDGTGEVRGNRFIFYEVARAGNQGL